MFFVLVKRELKKPTHYLIYQTQIINHNSNNSKSNNNNNRMKAIITATVMPIIITIIKEKQIKKKARTLWTNKNYKLKKLRMSVEV